MIKNKKVQFKMSKYQILHLGFKNKIDELEKIGIKMWRQAGVVIWIPIGIWKYIFSLFHLCINHSPFKWPCT